MFKNGNGARAEVAPVSAIIAENNEVDEADRPDDAPKAEAMRQIKELRHRIHVAVGQIALAMSAVPRYRHQSLADLQSLILDPLLRDRIAIATLGAAKDESNVDSGQESPQDTTSMAGVAIWASVSDKAEAKIREQIRAGVFPLRLKAEDWTSGDKA
ncbi:hypothetical protein [Methylosinus sp. Ce-a6]|uniref:hypothetical protein n=1 Tax=Methylosinus sp. Ce-a6 TaxID=2172005 RepID=UPI001FCEB102|nr:hypothetical protein [Methylosinus sp. Ce-a6]